MPRLSSAFTLEIYLNGFPPFIHHKCKELTYFSLKKDITHPNFLGIIYIFFTEFFFQTGCNLRIVFQLWRKHLRLNWNS